MPKVLEAGLRQAQPHTIATPLTRALLFPLTLIFALSQSSQLLHAPVGHYTRISLLATRSVWAAKHKHANAEGHHIVVHVSASVTIVCPFLEHS
jgi:hypothetical protein